MKFKSKFSCDEVVSVSSLLTSTEHANSSSSIMRITYHWNDKCSLSFQYFKYFLSWNLKLVILLRHEPFCFFRKKMDVTWTTAIKKLNCRIFFLPSTVWRRYGVNLAIKFPPSWASNQVFRPSMAPNLLAVNSR